MSKQFFQSKVGVAFGGGGARGIAHIGVIRAFEEGSFSPQCVSGTSAGALVAALYAFGKNAEEIERIFSSLSFSKISSFIPEKMGFVGNHGVAKLLEDELGDVKIEDAKIPLAIICSDLISGELKVFTSGPLALLVQASASFPVIFRPVEYENMLLIDGAFTENVPVSGVKKLGANFVVAVSLSDHKTHISHPKGMFDVVSRCFDILLDDALVEDLNQSNYTIELNLEFMSRFKLDGKEKAIALGYSKGQLMLSRSLWYWWSKPVLDYLHHIQKTAVQLLRALTSHPQLHSLPKLLKRSSEDS